MKTLELSRCRLHGGVEKKRGALKAKYGTICSRFQDQTGLRINVSSFMSYWEMNEMPPKDRCMQPYERENDRGVVIFQINV